MKTNKKLTVRAEIRRATNKHISEIQRLGYVLNNARTQFFSNATQLFHERIKESDPINQNDIKNDIVLVALVDHVVVGFAWGTISERKNHVCSRLGYIQEVCVDDSKRGLGIGRSLLGALIKEFKGRQCDHIATHTDWENEAAQKLYKSIGMSEATIELWKKI